MKLVAFCARKSPLCRRKKDVRKKASASARLARAKKTV